VPRPSDPESTVELRFQHEDELDRVDDPIREDASALAVVGRTLFTACDETATVERLLQDGDDWGSHHNVALGDVFDLPDGPDGEMDIEGLAADDGWLWVVGSHSLKRDKPDEDDDHAAALEELTDIDVDPNRWFLGRLPLRDDGDGVFTPVAELEIAGETRRAACVKMQDDGGSTLTKRMADDPHLAPFLDVPSKDNGFDVEGIAARGDRVWLGLRGPVLRGWATVLELRMKTTKKGWLKPRKIGEDGQRYRKHFCDLAGLGIRDMVFDGDALLLLSGPTMDLDGPVAVHRWEGALETEHHTVLGRDEVVRVLDLPHGEGVDHPEGIAVVEPDDGRFKPRMLVVHDNPAPGRLVPERRALVADVHPVPR
jgi:hypothetical protein